MTGPLPSRLPWPAPALRGSIAAALWLAVACGPAPRLGPPKPGGGGGGAGTYAEVSARILVPRCATAACHGGPTPLFAPALDLDLAYAANVGVASSTVPDQLLVAPGDPEASYLVQKTRGTQGGVGGGGSRMPLADSPLDDADQALLETWIANGAPHD
jgi:hypothetical protein